MRIINSYRKICNSNSTSTSINTSSHNGNTHNDTKNNKKKKHDDIRKSSMVGPIWYKVKGLGRLNFRLGGGS